MVKTSICIYILMMFFGQLVYAQPTSSEYKILKKYDKNNDERISFAEAPNYVQEGFYLYDVNRDGYISGTELSTMSSGSSSYKSSYSKANSFQRPRVPPGANSSQRPPLPPRGNIHPPFPPKRPPR